MGSIKQILCAAFEMQNPVTIRYILISITIAFFDTATEPDEKNRFARHRALVSLCDALTDAETMREIRNQSNKSFDQKRFLTEA